MIESLTLLFLIFGLNINKNSLNGNINEKFISIINTNNNDDNKTNIDNNKTNIDTNTVNICGSKNIENFFKQKYNVNLQNVIIAPKLSETQKKYIAHAGGMLGKKTYLNCYEAVKNSYDNGFRLIELDIEMTSDGVPIMLHSWDGFITAFFYVESDKIYSYDEFKNFQMINSWHQLSLKDVIELMDKEFLDMYLITDTKNDNKKLLDMISKDYNYMMYRIIPQVYNQEEYYYAKKLGFKNIIYTLYLSNDTMEEIIEFSKKEKPFAITMNTSWAYSVLPLELSKIDVYSYVHTINKKEDYEYLKKNGIKGVYTDVLFY